MKKIIIFCLFILSIFCFAQGSFAENFYIKNYDVVMNVDKYKNVQVEETIDAFFTNSSHGIFRTIPTENGDYIDNIRVNKQNTISKNFNLTEIKIGNPDWLVNGEQQYIIKYTYHIIDKKNEFYFNIIGNEWNTDINKTNFKITMPDVVDPDRVGLSIGRYGTRGFKDIAKYNVNENIISGTTLENLSPNEGVTIRVEVPKGYFIQSSEEKSKPLINIAMVLLLTAVSFGMWYIYGRDEHVTPVVSFCPPKELNSAQVGILHREYPTTKDVVSLVYYLATRGYIKIINAENSFVLQKLKEYDGEVEEEKLLMTALFGNKNSVSNHDLQYSATFYKDVKNIVKSLDNFKKSMLISSSNNLINHFILCLCTLGIAFFIILPFYNYSNLENLEQMLIIAQVVGLYSVMSNKSINNIAKIFFASLIMLFPVFWLAPSSAFIAQQWIIFPQIVCLIISIICWVNIPKWRHETVLIRGQISGFKHFLDVAEKHKIKELSKNDPNYAFDMIAFAYVLGISTKWIKILESIMLTTPDWYQGNFNHYSLHRFSNNFYNVSIPSVDNGGVSRSSSGGGGGFSGGGCGGGGGGSW